MNKMAKVGVLTIGQSPRTDLTPSIQRILGDQVEIIEAGGLDHIPDDELHLIAAKLNETTYISRLRSGHSVKISKEKLLPLLQKELIKLERKVDVTIMLCTGDFPTLKTTKPMIYPDKVLVNTIQAIQSEGKLGLIIPLEEQRDSLREKWHGLGLDLEVGVASPYEDSDMESVAKSLRDKGVDIIVLDCMGYDEAHKETVFRASGGLPVILPRSLVASIAKEYLGI